MKITNRYMKILVVALVPLFLNGCLNDLFKQDDHTYDGPDVVEFRPATRSVNESDTGTNTASANVQLIATSHSAALPINFSVDSGNSTAQAGTHYTMATPSPVTIAADQWSTPVTVQTVQNSLAAGNSVTLVLILDGNNSEGVSPSENYKTFTVTINGN